jgi:hypothetical protein
MICYRDQCYCTSDCINQTCVRYLSDEVKARANEVGLPIATADFSGECKNYQKEKTNHATN